MTNKKFKSILEDLLLSFPFQIPLMFTLVLGVHFLTRLSIWWCVPISFVLNIMYDIGERISIKVKKTPAALSQPEPEGLTDEELDYLWTEIDGGPDCCAWRPYARAVLARWGRPITTTETP